MTSAAILTGGHARRFDGLDKGTLTVSGRSIRSRQLDVLLAIADDVMLVERPGREPAWPDDARSLIGRVRVIHDTVEDCGPMGGLEAALREGRHAHVLVVAGDMPFLTAPFLSHLATLARHTPEADVVVPRTESGYHPLCAVYARRALPVVTRRLADGRFKLVDLIKDLQIREVAGAELDAFGAGSRLLANVNTAADYAALGDPSQHTA